MSWTKWTATPQVDLQPWWSQLHTESKASLLSGLWRKRSIYILTTCNHCLLTSKVPSHLARIMLTPTHCIGHPSFSGGFPDCHSLSWCDRRWLLCPSLVHVWHGLRTPLLGFSPPQRASLEWERETMAWLWQWVFMERTWCMQRYHLQRMVTLRNCFKAKHLFLD